MAPPQNPHLRNSAGTLTHTRAHTDTYTQGNIFPLTQEKRKAMGPGDCKAEDSEAKRFTYL